MAEGRWRKLWCPRSELDWDVVSRPIDIDRFVECAEARIRTEDACPDDQSRWRKFYGYGERFYDEDEGGRSGKTGSRFS
jgi:hypothetical protein